MSDFPNTAQAVIIGGGIVGCSTAYHLAKLGWDVVLIERKKLTSGTTFHAAGLVGQLRSSANITQLLGYSVDLYNSIEEETGLGTGWKMNGGLRLACNPERWTEVKRQATTAHSFGLDMQLLTPKEAQDLWPLMTIDDVIGAAYLPTDGQANPSDITQALAKGARMAGARIFEDTKVLSVDIEKGVIKGVETEKGRIETAIVIACCGQWTRSFAKTVGVNVPLVPMEHQYMVTERIDGMPANLPTLRDPDRLTYYKEEVGGLVMGGYEPNPKPWAVNGIPSGFHYTLLDSDYDHFEQMMELSLGRVPALEHAGIKELVNGPESFTPDGNFILGEAPELKNFFVGAGFNAYGIAAGGGAGMALAEWVAKGEPPFDLWPVDIRRFGRPHFDDDWIRTRTVEAYGKHYTMAWPSEEHDSARPCRKSPLYDTLKASGAVFGEKLGWERPNWYADTAAGEEQRDIYTFERPNWHGPVGREHMACREAAVLFDQTSFAKFALKGPDAEAALSWIASNDVAKPVGSLIYTQMLNDHGGIECDLTCVRVAEDEYYIVTGTGYATHDFDWISKTIPDGLNAQLFDVTSSYSVLSLMGPRARDILQTVTRDDVSNDAFPFGTAKTIGIAGCPVNALRVTYVGELGWELHLPVEYATTVYETLHAAGAKHGLINAGYRAIETLRLEKGYRAWGGDLTTERSPLEAGLTPFVRTDLRKALARDNAWGMALLEIEDGEIDPFYAHTVWKDGQPVGIVTSGAYGHRTGKALALAYLRDRNAREGLTVSILGRRRRATILPEAPFDPENSRLKTGGPI